MSRKLKFAIGFLAALLAWIAVAPFLAERLIVERRLEKADAILVLGGSRAYLERSRKAAEIFRENRAAKIFLTDDGERAGWSRAEQKNVPFVELAKRELTSGGVPENAVEILEPQVSGTIYEARILARAARERNLNSLLLVTSAYHTRRALWTFEREFGRENLSSEIGVEHAPLETSTTFWWLTRSGWRDAAGEYVKSLVYWVYY